LDVNTYCCPGGYQEALETRMNCLGISWNGDLGVQSSHYFQGIFIILTAPGISGNGDSVHAPYIQTQLENDSSVWRVSSWHKNQKAMQIGGKNNETGWSVYEESRRGGAIIATGHEHSYERTHLLSNMENRTVSSTSNTLILSKDDPNTGKDEGKSFVFVSGIAGKSIRNQKLCLPTTPPYGCSIYSSNQGANHGALFGEFNYMKNPCLAHFYFKDIKGNIPDDFFVESTMGTCS